ncbi:Histone deacetylation protein Rxt3 [Teratosphaeria destructans]|uniref:Histone deacetylation protein Rxt3 n=1 Tax=Teratosphaeria destructans TaxID=418781 RepID=A0A9W7W4G2_9PEZI|nr:Histone deacetylation protein Rxt3 [Teratosphaeria destructans]
MAHRPGERPPFSSHPPPAPGYPLPFAQPPPGPHQPPVQIPFSDPFQTSRDPFLHGRRGSFGPTRAWPSTSGNVLPPHPQHQPSPQQQPHQLPPPPPHAPHQNGAAHMPLPYDATRRGSLGSASSSPQYGRGPLDPPPLPPFATRNMPPPSSPQMLPPSSAATHLSSAPRGPPTASPFAGVRDLASHPSHRPGAGMSISSILGGGERDERKPQVSPHTTGFPQPSLPPSMRPPSPGRARSASMREGVGRREPSPLRESILGEPRAQSAFHDRGVSESKKEGIFASPQFQRESPHSFRAFRPEQEHRIPMNGLGRPSSQPIELSGPRTVDEIVGSRRDILPGEGRFGTFRQFGEAGGLLRRDMTPRHDAHPFPNGITSQPRERNIYGSPQTDRDGRPGPPRYAPGPFGNPTREESAGLFRPSYQQMPDHARESIEARHDFRREEPRSSPPISELGYIRGRNGIIDRPLALDEHQRMDVMNRDQQHRKGSDGSGPRSLFSGVSPELNRKGRTTPLPQAVQGAQPKHVGPGGDNPGIKMEFGRMFSGLGSGVKSATPTAGQTAHGISTPTRLSPSRQQENGDLVRTAVGSIEDTKSSSRPRGGRKSGRRSRDEERDGRGTPDSQRGGKRTKTTAAPHHHHHHLHGHHHHHHVHENGESQGGFGMMRFTSNPASGPPHHHHHQHGINAHPAHHHHHHHHPPAKSAPPSYKPALTVQTKALLATVADKPRLHLGSRIYSTELSQPANADVSLDAKLKYRSRMKVLPYLQDRENCTFTIRVPRYYLQTTDAANENDEPSPLAAICQQRQVWGTSVYTDDSDVVAAAVHSGWLKGDFGEFNDDLQHLCDDEPDIEANDDDTSTDPPLTFDTRPPKPAKIPASHDLHITVLILPALDQYVSTTQHCIRSREWRGKHDGMSYMVHRIEFVDEGPATRFCERGLVAKKQRMAIEEAARREAAAGLLMFANGGGEGRVSVSVGA